jgi:hexokinase
MRDVKAPIHIAVANDAVCLLLSEANTANWSRVVGGIVGTGTNYAITLPDKTVVNLESGNFHAFPLSDSGKYIDEESKDKGRQLIEKEISGAYLFKHYNYYIKRESIDAPLLTSTTQLSEIAENSAHIGSKIAQLILGRSAALTAAQIAGIFLFKTHCTGIARNATNLAHLTFVMEGNLFWHGWKYKENVERNLDALGLHDNISFTQNEHHSIKGALHLLTGLW